MCHLDLYRSTKCRCNCQQIGSKVIKKLKTKGGKKTFHEALFYEFLSIYFVFPFFFFFFFSLFMCSKVSLGILKECFCRVYFKSDYSWIDVSLLISVYQCFCLLDVFSKVCLKFCPCTRLPICLNFASQMWDSYKSSPCSDGSLFGLSRPMVWLEAAQQDLEPKVS